MTTRFIVSPHVCSSSSSDGSTILHLQKGVLYSVIGVGSLIWTKLTARAEGLTLSEIVSAIRKDFVDIPEERIRHDAEQLLEQLAQKGIVELSDENPNRFSQTSSTHLNSLVEWLTRQAITGLLKLGLNSTAAFFALASVDWTLSMSGFAALHRFVNRWSIAKNLDGGAQRVTQVCAAVDRAVTKYPKHALCLQRSAVATCLLRSYGVPAQMVIACRKTPFEGHAWVEVHDSVVNDTPKVKAFYSSVLVRC